MNSIYVIQDAKGQVYGATYEIQKAVQICSGNPGCTYRRVPFWSLSTTVITVISNEKIL